MSLQVPIQMLVLVLVLLVLLLLLQPHSLQLFLPLLQQRPQFFPQL